MRRRRAALDLRGQATPRWNRSFALSPMLLGASAVGRSPLEEWLARLAIERVALLLHRTGVSCCDADPVELGRGQRASGGGGWAVTNTGSGLELPAVLVALLLIGWWRHLACQRGLQQQARERAEMLLQEILTPEEYVQLNTRHRLEVPSRQRAGRVYHIPEDGFRPVTVYEWGVPTVCLCLRPLQPLPPRETVLVHKLLLEADEDDYWRRANILPPLPAPAPWPVWEWRL